MVTVMATVTVRFWVRNMVRVQVRVRVSVPWYFQILYGYIDFGVRGSNSNSNPKSIPNLT
jgi:hypothetical protein